MRLSGMEAALSTNDNEEDYQVYMKQLNYANFLMDLSMN
jgi:hypothetical protein